MAYGTKFRAVADSVSGVAIEVLIQKDGYTGAVIDRPFGRTPRLRLAGDVVVSTSVEFALECRDEDEFAELYTSSATEYKVLYYYGGALVFSGFITPELYAASWVDPPYDVHIVASDNLAELKGRAWTNTQRLTLAAVFSTLLGATGTGFGIYWCSSLSVGSGSPASMPSVLSLSLANMTEDGSYHDVLTAVLRTLHARLVQCSGKWCVFRETDLSGMISSGWLRSNTGTNMWRIRDFGSASAFPVWPVDHMTMEIQPAHCSQKLVFEPDFRPRELVRHVNAQDYVYALTVNDEIAHVSAFRVRLVFSGLCVESNIGYLRVRGFGGEWLEDNSLDGIKQWTPPVADDSFVYESITYKLTQTSTGGEVVFDVPAAQHYPGGQYYRGALEICFEHTPSGCVVETVTVESVDTWDLTEDVRLSNGARTPADEIPLAVSDVDPASEPVWISNAWSMGGSFDVPFKTAAIPNGEQFRYLIARDYAFSHANPRLALKGTLSTSGIPYTLVYGNRGINYLVRRLDWDAYNEETDVELVSLPASALEVEDITFTQKPRR